MCTNVMLDLETMGTSPNAAIVAIGAVFFDIDKNIVADAFYEKIDLASSVRNGGIIEPDTVKWWLAQKKAARREIIYADRTIESALNEFSKWINKYDSDPFVWGNGAGFDNVILSQAYKRAGIKTPWGFNKDRCYRTLKALRPDVEHVREGIHHHALDDAIYQAEHLIKIFHEIRVNGRI